VVLTSEGKVYTWGRNYEGQLGDGTNTERLSPVPVDMSGVLAGKTVTTICAGDRHTMVLTSEGKLYCWGSAPGTGSTGPNTPFPVYMSAELAGKTVIAISAGYAYSVALTSEGKLYAWGWNGSGQLGDGTTNEQSRPHAVDMGGVLAGKTVVAISAGHEHTLALTSEGRVYAWGRNDFGRLGDGTTTRRTSPVEVDMSGALAGKSVVAVSAGTFHSTALTSDGKVYAWGGTEENGLGDGSTADSAIPVAVSTAGVLAGEFVTRLSAGRDRTMVLTSVTSPVTTVIFHGPTRGPTPSPGDPVPGAGEPGSGIPGGATFKSFGLPAIAEDGGLAFLSTFSTGNTAIMAGNPLRLVAMKGAPAPGTDARFASFKDPVPGSGGHVAFLATINGGTSTSTSNQGVWTNIGGDLELVALEGAQPAGVPGAQWKTFESVALPSGYEGGPIILATMVAGVGEVTSASDTGLWGVDTAGYLHLLIREGADINVEGTTKTVRSFSVLSSTSGSPGVTRSFNARNEIVYRATFTDASTALVKVQVP